MICEDLNYSMLDNIELVLISGCCIAAVAILLFIGLCDTLKRKFKNNENPYDKIE